MKNVFEKIFIVIIVVLFIYFEYNEHLNNKNESSYLSSNIPDYSDEEVIILDNNEPFLDIVDFKNESFEEYGSLDNLGRCTYGYANIGVDLMPKKNREDISHIKPTGWHSVKYDIIPDDMHLFNRCHLIAFQLTAEDDNKKNLITCTKYTNSELMTKYEEMVGNYIRKTKNHVLYRVKPIFDYDNLIAKGIEMEAMSVEDNGEGIKYHVFIYNIQPGIEIDYKTGESHLINN